MLRLLSNGPLSPPGLSTLSGCKAFACRAIFGTMDRIQRGIAPMLFLIAAGLIVAVLAFGAIPLAVSWGAKALTRWLTGRD